MQIDPSDDQRAIHDAVSQICAEFDDDYWTKCEDEARFPEEYSRLMADQGWLGITMPEEVGGANLGVTEAAIMMHACSN